MSEFFDCDVIHMFPDKFLEVDDEFIFSNELNYQSKKFNVDLLARNW